MKDFTHYSLLAHNTFGIDVCAARFVECETVDELRRFLSMPETATARLLPVGGGSNLLFTGDFDGTVLHTAIRGTEVVAETSDEVTVRVGAGEVWDDFVAYTVAQGWYGAENLSLIPGEVGASAVQNIGAYGVEAKDLIVQVETLSRRTGEARTFGRDECRYAYRRSIFKEELQGQYIVTHVTYRLSKQPCFRLDYGNIRSELEKEGGEVTLQRLREVIVRIRQEKLPDPAVTGNAGSFFMNPLVTESRFVELKQAYPDLPHYPATEGQVKLPAGWLIDRCGWKGRTLGRAGVHPKQALVLVNLGGATGEDVLRLAAAVRQSVRERFGIDLQPEVNFL